MDEAEEDVDRCRYITRYILAGPMMGAELTTCSRTLRVRYLEGQ
jgi:hypothetical protein